MDIGEVAGRPFGGSIEASWIGRMMLARVKATGQDIHRTDLLVREATAGYFQVAVVNSGVGRVAQDGRQAVLYPGDVVVYETTRPVTWDFQGSWDVSVFTFPSDAVPLSEDERRRVTATRLDGQGALTGVTSRFLLDLARLDGHVPPVQSERLLSHAGDLVVTMLSGWLDDSDSVSQSVYRSQLLRIKDYIDRHLDDPALGPVEIATAVGVSPRYLHKMFEEERRTVSQYIRNLRLERCRRDLLDRRYTLRPIAAIAYGHGFGDLSAFNRAFRRKFGVSPRDLRRSPL